jgi:hypothetical protein
MKTTAFWDIALCSLVRVDRRLRASYCLHRQGDHRTETTRRYVQEAVVLKVKEFRVNQSIVFMAATMPWLRT